jgi:putative ABC transport system substrate-binding protein
VTGAWLRYLHAMHRPAGVTGVGIGLLAVGMALLGFPSAAEAQSSAKLPRVAFLSGDETCATNRGFSALLEGLRAFGYRAGENLVIDCRCAEGKYEELDALAAELVRLGPAVLVAAASPASLAAQRSTRTVPIVSVYSADPVGLGLVASLARPDANVTGISALAADHAAKSLQILKELAPRTSRAGVLGYATNPTFATYLRELEPAARTLGIQLEVVGVESAGEIESALASMTRRGADGLLVMHQPFTFVQRASIVGTAARLRLPAIYGSREAVEAGGLVSYAVNVGTTFRRAAFFVNKVLKGSRIADLPFEQPTNLELVLNLKTAAALGLSVPSSFRLRADHIIE